jgi:S-adenosylmethionine synthetase
MSQESQPPVVVSAPAAAHPDSRDVEMVERKGRGHPDSICDALAEAFTISLTRVYHEHCGVVLHHNVDKVLLAAGSSAPRFGGGEVTAPFEIFLAGRATREIDGTVIPVTTIAEDATRAWLRANLHALDVERHVRIHTLVRPGSTALSKLVAREQSSRVVANDTSFAVGYAPPSRLERAVLAVEQSLTSSPTIAAHPMIGEDVKVMGLRRGDKIDLTIACAMVDRHLRGPADYADAKALVTRLAEDAASQAGSPGVRVTVNTADDVASGRVYLTVSGTSAEAGDDGQTGRGNRVGGLITPYRPMTLEAAAGKNVVSHIGKSYSIVAHQIARELVATCPEIAEATCLLVSRIGSPVEAPQLVELQIQTRRGIALETVRELAEAIARENLRRMTELSRLLIERGSIESPADWAGILLF